MELNSATIRKLKNKDHANIIKYGMSNLQNTLRERCRKRMRERRDQVFNKNRDGLEFNSGNVQHTLAGIVHDEFRNLMTSSSSNSEVLIKYIDEPMNLEEAIELEHEIFNEQAQYMLDEHQKWIAEMEKLEAYCDKNDEEVICPKCQKSILFEQNNNLGCVNCGLELIGQTLQEFKNLISQNVESHSSCCHEVPSFIIIPDNQKHNLYLICNTCSTLSLIC